MYREGLNKGPAVWMVINSGTAGFTIANVEDPVCRGPNSGSYHSGEVRECGRFRRRTISSPRTISGILPEIAIHEFRDKLDHSDDRSENAARCINPDGNCDCEAQSWRHPESRSK